MNPIVPHVPNSPRITEKPPSAVPTSLEPNAVTAWPGRHSGPAPASAPGPAGRPRVRLRRAIAAAVVALLGVVAVTAARHARAPRVEVVSGRTSPKKTQSGQDERWFRARATITLDASLGKLSPAAADAVEEAFGQWIESDGKLPRLAFDSRPTKPLTLAPDGENRVYYAPIRVPGHEGDLGVTLAYTNPDTGEIVEADVVLNSNTALSLFDTPAPAKTEGDDSSGRDGRRSSHGPHGTTSSTTSSTTTPSSSPVPASCKNQYDFRSVVTHEAGHFFGLAEDTTDASATMYYSTRPCDAGKRDLQSDDASAIASLYASSEQISASGEDGPETASVQKCSAAHVGARGAPASGVVFALSAALAGVRRRRARRATPLSVP